MRDTWFLAAIVAVALSGCAPKEEPSAKPAADQSLAHCPTDDFHLPLVIVLEVPEAPPEIVGPSPPIKESDAARKQ